MRRPRTAMVPAALLLGGCAASPVPRMAQAPAAAPAPDPMVKAVVARAADQVRPCYRAPRVPREARQIITTIGVAFAPDGQIAGQPVVVQQIGVTPETAPFAGQMAEAAIAAVLRCAPLNLPAQYYQGGWDDFVLTFSPKGLA